MKNILWNATTRQPWMALLLLACILASGNAVLAQGPDVTETEKAQPEAPAETQPETGQTQTWDFHISYMRTISAQTIDSKQPCNSISWVL
jgi:hypothetical protein